jgi:hypothetical protein
MNSAGHLASDPPTPIWRRSNPGQGARDWCRSQLGEVQIRLFGMVNAAPAFDRMPQVIDGAPDLLYELFAPKFGQHALSGVGLAIPVDINGEFELNV